MASHLESTCIATPFAKPVWEWLCSSKVVGIVLVNVAEQMRETNSLSLQSSGILSPDVIFPERGPQDA